MNFAKKNISVFLLYQLGINLYFCFWFLGSEGSASLWHYDGVTFYDLWMATNIALPLGLISLDVLRKLTADKARIHIGFVKVNFILQSLFISVLFTILLFIVTSQLADDHDAAYNYVTSIGFLSLTIYHFNLSLLIVALLNLNERLGGIRRVFSYLLQWVTPPKEVEKAFLFIDLNDSTFIAERLKSDVFSGLIRDSFRVLNEIIIEHHGIEIYQYVGDEAVVCWDFNDQSLCLKGLKIFKEFQIQLQKKRTYFQDKYNIVPTFKAAIHGGVVTQSEIGMRVIHKAYHGDVLNTTSRIEGLCKGFNTDLLISDDFHQKIQRTLSAFHFEKISDVNLVGKVKKYTLYKLVDPVDKETNFPEREQYKSESIKTKIK